MDSVHPIYRTSNVSPVASRPSAERRNAVAITSAQEVSPLNTADIVDLSPIAQTYLSRYNNLNRYGDIFGNYYSDTFGFYLTQAQEEKIAEILAKHKGEPANQETFDRIFADLAANGLSPQQLAAQDQLQFFDPFASLLGVAGTTSSNDNFLDNTLNTPLTHNSFPNEQANMNAYILQIITQFLGISVIQ